MTQAGFLRFPPFLKEGKGCNSPPFLKGGQGGFLLIAALFLLLIASPFTAFGYEQPAGAHGAAAPSGSRPDLSWTERAVTEEELLALYEKDPALDLETCREILGRLNGTDSPARSNAK